jgi:hypothetical protein
MAQRPITIPTTYINPYQRRATGPIVTITGSILMGIDANKEYFPSIILLLFEKNGLPLCFLS